MSPMSDSTPQPLTEEQQSIFAGLPTFNRSKDEISEAFNTFRTDVWRSLEKYSSKLGWGIVGHQPECWTCLDMAVDELKDRRDRSEQIVRIVERSVCGCISLDCATHGAYIPEDLAVMREIIEKRSLL